MKKLLILILCLHRFHCQVGIDILYTQNTDLDLLEIIVCELEKIFNDQIALKPSQITTEIDIINLKERFTIILDLTFSLSLSRVIKELANESHFIHINVGDPPSTYDEWQFFTHSSTRNHVDAISTFVEYLDWEKFIAISNENYSPILNEFENEFQDKDFGIFYYVDQPDQISSDLLIGKQLKPTGIRNIIMLNEGESIAKLLKSLKKKHILNLGSGVILGSHSIWGAIEDGLIAIVESELENSKNHDHYEALALAKLIKIILNYQEPYDSLALREHLEKYTTDHRANSNFTLINIQNGKKKNVGSIINKSISLTHQIIYPGNSLEKPNAPISYINISMADGITNPGYANSIYGNFIKQGAWYALKYIESINFLDNFELKVTRTDCGSEVYNKEYSLSCFTKLKDQLGVGHLTTAWANVCIGTIQSLRALNISIPNISEFAPPIALKNKSDFPEFMRITKDNRFHAGVILNLATIFKWKNIIALYENSPGPALAYQYLEMQAAKSHINIVNSPDQRLVKANYRHTDLPQYRPMMENIINSKVRIFVVFMNSPSQFYFIEDMYDIGLRKGDVVLNYYSRVAYSLIAETDPIQKQKLIELLHGSIIIEQADWVGNFGQEIKEGFMKTYSDGLEYRCFSFDSAMLLLHGIKFTLNRGDNIEDPAVLNKWIRQQRFTGCTGTVSITSDSNERSFNVIGIYNMRWNETAQQVYELEVGKYDLGSTRLLHLHDDIIWYDSTTNVPTDVIIKDKCLLDKDEIEYSHKNAAILYGITLGVVLIAASATFKIWKNFWNVGPGAINTKVLVKAEDYIVMLMILIDFLQYIAMGPDINGYDILTSTVASYATIDFDLSAVGGAFWVYFYIITGATFLWIYLSSHIVFRIDRMCDNCICNYSKQASRLIMPVIVNAFFLPIILVLLSVFQCDQRKGSRFSESTVHNDCTVYCWKEFHITVATVSIFALILYLPMAIYFRACWDRSHGNVNIKTRPFIIIVKSLLQVLIIVLNKILKNYNQSLYGLVYILLLLGFLFLCIKKKPYNYERCNLWSTISLISVIWSVILSSLYWILSYKSIVIWVSFQFAGWILLIGLGFYIQCKYFPSLLYSEDSIDIALYFRFALGKSVSALEINKSRRLAADKKYEVTDSVQAFIE